MGGSQLELRIFRHGAYNTAKEAFCQLRLDRSQIIMRNKLLNWIFIIIFIVLTFNLISSWWRLYQKGDVIKEAEMKLELSREKQEELKRSLAKTKSSEFIEKQAREKLNLSREGEVVLLLPPITPIIEVSPTPQENLPNWKKWVRLFW